MKNLIANSIAEQLHRLATDTGNPITSAIGMRVARIMLEEKHSRIEWDESPWDVSSRAVRTANPFDLAQYETVEQFLEAEATGNTVATYCPGHGFAAETYSAEFVQHAGDLLYRYIVDNFPDARDQDEQDRMDDEIYEFLADELLEYEFMQPVQNMPIQACLEKYSAAAKA